jgi:transcriptional regulator with XRE-family HTH domain
MDNLAHAPYLGHMSTVVSMSIVPQWTFGERVRKARTHASLSRTQLAEELGLHPSTIANWERDERMPTKAMSRKAARACGVSEAWLWSGAGDDDPTSADGRAWQDLNLRPSDPKIAHLRPGRRHRATAA